MKNTKAHYALSSILVSVITPLVLRVLVIPILGTYYLATVMAPFIFFTNLFQQSQLVKHLYYESSMFHLYKGSVPVGVMGNMWMILIWAILGAIIGLIFYHINKSSAFKKGLPVPDFKANYIIFIWLSQIVIGHIFANFVPPV